MDFIKKINISLAYRFKLLYTYFKRKEIFLTFGHMKIRYLNSDLRVFYQIFIEENYHFFPNGYKPSVIVDLGANVGYSSIWFHKFFPESRIIALEPESENFKFLSKNIEPFKRITAIKKAIWYQDEDLFIKNPEALSWSFETSKFPKNGSIRIEGISINTLMNQFDLQKIDLLKIDIEGAEFDLFKHEPLNWLQNIGAIMIETHDKKQAGTSELIDSVLINAGFKKFSTRDLSCFFKDI